MDYGFQLGRRFRALKLWMVLNYYGVDGIKARIREHIRLAEGFADWAENNPDFELMAPVEFSTDVLSKQPLVDGSQRGGIGRIERTVVASGERIGKGVSFPHQNPRPRGFALRHRQHSHHPNPT